MANHLSCYIVLLREIAMWADVRVYSLIRVEFGSVFNCLLCIDKHSWHATYIDVSEYIMETYMKHNVSTLVAIHSSLCKYDIYPFRDVEIKLSTFNKYCVF